MLLRSTICCFSATGTTTHITAYGRLRGAPSWSRQPSATRRWVCRSSNDSFPGRPCVDVHSARGAQRDDSGGLRQMRACRRSSWESVRTCLHEPAAGAGPQHVQCPRPCRVRAAASTTTRAARSCSNSSTHTSTRGGPLSLVLVGNSLLPIPKHPRIRHLDYLGDADKFDAMAAAELLVMPEVS